MTKAQIREVMRQAIDPHKLCRMLLQYEENCRFRYVDIFSKYLPPIPEARA